VFVSEREQYSFCVEFSVFSLDSDEIIAGSKYSMLGSANCFLQAQRGLAG
jgi:hypothetical protein